MNVAHRFDLLVAVCDFGWGSIGKLRLILDELDDACPLVYGPAAWADQVHDLLAPVHTLKTFAGASPPQVALVINDPVAADDIAALGSRVIYVDSLPYLWVRPEEVPARVAVYCAQRSPIRALARGNPLAVRDDIRWVAPIVPQQRKATRGDGIVVNVGGLHSHLSSGAAEAYVDLVVVPLVRMLRAAGHRVSAVCGNLPPDSVERLQEMLGDAVVGRQTAYRFESLLERADVLMTSPGSTTLLQAAALDVPTILLPPQNLSQILHGDIYASDDTVVTRWPDSVVDLEEVRRLGTFGEDAALGYIYAAIERAAMSLAARDGVCRVLRPAVESVATATSLASLVSGPVSGASEVARIVRELACPEALRSGG